jgi:bifunctional DNase/RNase
MPSGSASLVFVALTALACSEARPVADEEVPVHVGAVAVDDHDLPVVILEETGGSRALRIWIGTAEATSIALQINDRHPPRPNFHDLAQRVIFELDAEVTRVVVTELRGGTYYAILALRSNGRDIEIDVRPSDGIAVALRTKAPILVRESVFERASRPPGWDPEAEPELEETGRSI